MGKFQRTQSSKTQYRGYLDFLTEVGSACGFRVEEDCLRIPSTKRVCAGHRGCLPWARVAFRWKAWGRPCHRPVDESVMPGEVGSDPAAPARRRRLPGLAACLRSLPHGRPGPPSPGQRPLQQPSPGPHLLPRGGDWLSAPPRVGVSLALICGLGATGG